MLQKKANKDKLFTFGQGELEQCLAQQKKQKFPFLQNTKIKKAPLIKRIISVQRQKQFLQDENNDINILNDLKIRGRIMSHQETRKVAFSLNKQTFRYESNRNSPCNNKQKRKSSLPKVLKAVFPNLVLNTPNKNKIPEVKLSSRYLFEGQSFQFVKASDPAQPIQGERYQSGIENNRPKSVMLLSQLSTEIPEQKIQTIQHHRNRIFTKIHKDKNGYGKKCSKVGLIDTKIIQNINQFKKIYC